MKAIVNTAPGRLEWQDRPLPQPSPGEVRIRTAACGICATDLEMIAGWDRTPVPAVPGHEWSGVVDAAGEGADGDLVGKACVAENVLRDGGEVGFEHPGGYGEFFLTDAENVHVLGEDMGFAEATLIEPLAVAVRGIGRLWLENRSRTLVLGDGPLGLLVVLLLRLGSVEEVAVVGGRPERLSLARELGATATANYHEISGDLATGVADALGDGFPNIIEAAGSARAMEAAIDLADEEGKILVLGDYGDATAGFPWNHLLHRQLEIIGSNASAGAWAAAVRLATEQQDDLAKLITHRLPAQEFQRGIDLMNQRSEPVTKVVLHWSEGSSA